MCPVYQCHASHHHQHQHHLRHPSHTQCHFSWLLLLLNEMLSWSATDGLIHLFGTRILATISHLTTISLWHLICFGINIFTKFHSSFIFCCCCCCCFAYFSLFSPLFAEQSKGEGGIDGWRPFIGPSKSTMEANFGNISYFNLVKTMEFVHNK